MYLSSQTLRVETIHRIYWSIPILTSQSRLIRVYLVLNKRRTIDAQSKRIQFLAFGLQYYLRLLNI